MKNVWKEAYQELKEGIHPAYLWAILLVCISFFSICFLTSCGTTFFPFQELEEDIVEDVCRDVIGVDPHIGSAAPK